jgi:hypothetical protein
MLVTVMHKYKWTYMNFTVASYIITVMVDIEGLSASYLSLPIYLNTNTTKNSKCICHTIKTLIHFEALVEDIFCPQLSNSVTS